MRTAVFDSEMVAYLAEAKGSLSDLPEGEQQGLLEDLAQMLVEVSAEIEGSIRSLLGPPEEMIAELRASAGLVALPTDDGGRRSQGRPARSSLLDLKKAKGKVDRAVESVLAAMPGVLRRLLPAWWVVRGLGIVAGLAYLTSYAPHFKWWSLVPMPQIFNSALLGFMASGVAVISSISLGLEREQGRRSFRSAVVNVIAVLAIFATLMAIKDLSFGYYPQAYDVQQDYPIATYAPVTYAPNAYTPDTYAPVTYAPETYQVEIQSIDELRAIADMLAAQGTSVEEAQMGWIDGSVVLQGPSGEELLVPTNLMDAFMGTTPTTTMIAP